MTKGNRKALVLLPLWLLVTACVDAGDIRDINVGQLLGGGEQEGELDSDTVARGLKEALRVGSERTVSSTSQTDGFWGNALIRIAMPPELDNVASTLRRVGMSRYVDEMELSMNRAAEKASGEALTVFVQAINGMTLGDVWDIYNGGENAATRYFRGKTEDSLRERFRPIVQEKMREVGLYQAYNAAVDQYMRVPFVSKPSLNLDEYVTNRSLDGLFTVLSEEEARIRKDPVARTTELLRKVFGS